MPWDNNNEDGFEKEQKNILINTMVQNILSFEQIYNYFENAITMAPCKDFKLLGLFQDIHYEKLNFPTLFFGQPQNNQGIKMSYQKITQWELLHKNHDFATHIPNLFFKAIILGHQLQVHEIINNPNLDVMLHLDLRYMDLSQIHTSFDI